MNGILHVTGHAIERYQERVSNVSREEAITLLSSPIIRKAGEIGCCNVKLPGGQRVIIKDNCVITVRPDCRSKRRRFKPEREE